MDTLPKNISKLFKDFSAVLARPTFQRFGLLLLAAILTTGARTVSNLLRTVDFFVSGHSSSYHRVFSHRHWSTWKLSKILTGFILEHYYSDETHVQIVGDDTVDEHPGRKVFGKGKHRDPVRSSHKFTAFRWGHKWVVLSILVKFSFSHRPWALPVLIALYTPPAVSKKLGRRHRTPSHIMQALVSTLIHWFPQRRFICAVDSGCSSHKFARFAGEHRKHLTLISKFYPNANLYTAPSPQNSRGRPRIKGRKLASPEKVVARTKDRERITVHWYGGEKRRVETIMGRGHWYKRGEGIVEMAWIFVQDLTGTHRDEYFFTTDVSMTAKQVIEAYTGRWSIEVTFEDARAYVGLGTTRGRTRSTVNRVAPCLFGLFSIIALIFDHLPRSWKRINITWDGKQEITFSDAITAVRRWLWVEWIFETLKSRRAFQKFPPKFQRTLLYNLAPAA